MYSGYNKHKTCLSSKTPTCLIYKTLTFILYDLINHPNIMGACRSCGQFTKQTLTMGAKGNASFTGNRAQESKPMTSLEWKCSLCSYTNEEDESRAVFGDTDEGGLTCIVCCNLYLPSSDEVLLLKK
jgi:hypothetical protein